MWMKLQTSVLLAFCIAHQALAAPTSSIKPRQGPLVLKGAEQIPSTWQSKGVSPKDNVITYDLHLGSPNDGGLDERIQAAAKGQAEWLTVEELKGFVGATEETKQQVIQSLTSKGVKAEDISFNVIGNTLTVKSTVAQASDIFSASFDDYSHQSRPAVSRTRQLTIPDGLSQHVVAISPLLDFPRLLHLEGDKAPALTSRAALTTRAGPAECDVKNVTPACLAALYGYVDYQPKADDPTLGILAVGDSGWDPKDLDNFLKKYKPSASGYQPDHVTYDGGNFAAEAVDGEAALDIDTVAGAIAPIASTLYISGDYNGDFFASTFKYLIGLEKRPAVFSMSYGLNENSVSAQQANSMCQYAKQLTALGTTLVVASGDNGVNGLHPGQAACPDFVPTYPSGCQYILSVGATAGFDPEVTVNNVTDRFWGGGGFSKLFPAPDFQQPFASGYLSKIGSLDSGEYDPKGRGFPDVAAQGSLYAIEDGGPTNESGTSASAPTVASILALLNSARKAAGKGLVGWVHPTFYANPDAFTDVTKGGAYGCDNGDGFPALEGWDPASGLGTLNFAKLRTLFGV